MHTHSAEGNNTGRERTKSTSRLSELESPLSLRRLKFILCSSPAMQINEIFGEYSIELSYRPNSTAGPICALREPRALLTTRF